jgi:hypothetical protein
MTARVPFLVPACALLFAPALFCGGSGSSSGGSVYRCEFTSDASARFDCWEWVNEPLASVQQQCASYGITPQRGPCDRSRLVGGCRIQAGDRTLTMWYGPPATPAEIQNDCMGQEYLPGAAAAGSPDAGE